MLLRDGCLRTEREGQEASRVSRNARGRGGLAANLWPSAVSLKRSLGCSVMRRRAIVHIDERVALRGQAA